MLLSFQRGYTSVQLRLHSGNRRALQVYLEVIHVKITPGLHLLRCCSPAETHLTYTGFLKCRCFCLYRLNGVVSAL